MTSDVTNESTALVLEPVEIVERQCHGLTDGRGGWSEK